MKKFNLTEAVKERSELEGKITISGGHIRPQLPDGGDLGVGTQPDLVIHSFMGFMVDLDPSIPHGHIRMNLSTLVELESTAKLTQVQTVTLCHKIMWLDGSGRTNTYCIRKKGHGGKCNTEDCEPGS
jgi:hypothetical protein